MYVILKLKLVSIKHGLNLIIPKTKFKLFRRSEFKGLDLSAFKTEQIFYPSKDGTAKIPMFLVSKKVYLRVHFQNN